MVLAPSTPAVRHTNSLLASMNAALNREVKECDQNLALYAKANELGPGDIDPAGDWTRKVTVTMHGPRFVSMVAEETHFCGGAYPDNDFYVVVFDMKTGEPVEEDVLISNPQDKAGALIQTVDGVAFPELAMPGLAALAANRAEGECKQILSQEILSFGIWPDARSGLLMARPTGLPHVVQACEEPIGLQIDEARGLGFTDEILGALEQAHQAASNVRQ